MTAKEILLKIKAAFDMPIAPPAAPPAPPVPPAAPVAKIYKLLDGTEISITQAGEMPAVGDMVTIGGVPAPEGPYPLDTGATITVGPGGAITLYTAMAAPAPPPPTPPAPIVPAQPVTLSAEEVAAMYAKFATGTPEDRLANLEIMMKALMETNFGYEIRKGQEQTAIQAYKDSLATMQTTVDTATAQMQSAFEKVDQQAETIAKHQQTIKDLFELVEKLVELPTGDPKTLTGPKKEQFSDKKQSRIEKMAEAVKTMKEEAKK